VGVKAVTEEEDQEEEEMFSTPPEILPGYGHITIKYILQLISSTNNRPVESS